MNKSRVVVIVTKQSNTTNYKRERYTKHFSNLDLIILQVFSASEKTCNSELESE